MNVMLCKLVEIKTGGLGRKNQSQKRNCAASVPISTFMCLWAIYIFPETVCLFFCRKIQYVDRFWEYLNRSQRHECGNWDWASVFPSIGIHKWDFRGSVISICWNIVHQYCNCFLIMISMVFMKKKNVFVLKGQNVTHRNWQCSKFSHFFRYR